MDGLTMRYELTLLSLMRRAESIFGHKPIISYAQNGERFSYTYREMIRRAKRLALALQGLGVQPGERVSTLAWNHQRHLEAFWAFRPAARCCMRSICGYTPATWPILSITPRIACC